MLRLAVCGNDQFDQDRLCRILTEDLNAVSAQSDITRFLSGVELLAYIQETGTFDIIFLDAEMKGLNGIETALELRRYDPAVLIVFLAATQDYAVGSYAADALHYMLKPVLPADLGRVLHKAEERLCSMDISRLCVKSSVGLYSILYRDILYLQSTGHRVSVITSCMLPIAVYGKLDEYEQVLQSDCRFIRIHKSSLVNAGFISYFGTDAVLLTNHTELSVSRALRTEARQKYLDFLYRSGACFPGEQVYSEVL